MGSVLEFPELTLAVAFIAFYYEVIPVCAVND